MYSKPHVVMTALELSFSFSAEEIFVLINSRNKKRFPKKCSECVSQCRPVQKICVMEETPTTTTRSSCLVW